MKKDYEQIELRSEKVRNIIGRIPPLLIRSGITLITLLIAGLATATCFIPYPENVKGKVEVTINSHSEIEIIAFIPYTEIKRLEEGMPVSITMDGYSIGTDSHLNGKVKTIYKKVYKKEGKNYFRIDLKLNNAVDYFKMENGMYCNHSIIRPEPDEKSLAHRSVQITPVSISVTENILAGIENVIPELFPSNPSSAHYLLITSKLL